MITVRLIRDDGDIAEFAGPAALSAVMQSDIELPEDLDVADLETIEELLRGMADMPVISLRADNKLQLVVMIGALVGYLYQELGTEGLQAASLVASATGFGDTSEMSRAAPRL